MLQYALKELKASECSLMASIYSSTTVQDAITDLLLQIKHENNILHLKITDSEHSRYQIPTQFVNAPLEIKETLSSVQVSETNSFEFGVYNVVIYSDPFNFCIERFGQTVFDTKSKDPLHNSVYFTNQHIRISTSLSPNSHIYGLGERGLHYHLPASSQKMALFCKDAWPNGSENSYSAHPVYMEMRDGKAFGAFLRNSNAMDVRLTSEFLSFDITGGVLDFYFYSGPRPLDIIQQHCSVVGLPVLPPRWSLGFHQCRYGYKSIKQVRNVVDNFRKHHIPLETVWLDIDYMDGASDFSFDEENFNITDVISLSKDIHAKKQKLVVILDPAIPIRKNYTPYTLGLKMDIFVKNAMQENAVGVVWPGKTLFVDFMNPNSQEYWGHFIRWLYSSINIDGLWIDMNEPSNFINGEGGEYRDNLNSPPYKINNSNVVAPLYANTLPMDAVHYGGLKEYDVHNMYGLSESIVTYNALKEITGRRPFVLSRSTFPGSGRYAGHWSGDNSSLWSHMFLSIPQMLNFQLFGIPLVGADIGGFNGEAGEELSLRWMQIGAFYPFSRNHNAIGMKDQEPYLWPSVAETSRKYLGMRNSLISFWYTIAYKSSSLGLPMIYSLFFEYPEIEELYWVDWEFLVGGVFLVIPVVSPHTTQVNGYIPPGNWYNYETWEKIQSSDRGGYQSVDAPLDVIPVFIRGGRSFFTQRPELTTEDTVNNDYCLMVAFNGENQSTGELFLDDGESETNNETSTHLTVEAMLEDEGIEISISGRFNYSVQQKITKICLIGFTCRPINSVKINGEIVKRAEITQKEKNRNLVGYVIENLSISINEASRVEIS